MKKWLRRLLLVTAIVLVVVIGVALVGIWLVRAEPAFYRQHIALTADQLEAAAQRATNKFATIQNQAARLRAAERAAATQQHSPDVLPSTLPDRIVVSFTADELNAFFAKWAKFQNWQVSYERYVEDPVVILQDGRIILAARVKELDLVASLHFEPRIDEKGALDLQLVQILGGRLPLPEGLIARYEDQLTAALGSRLPTWQREANLDAAGAANASAITACAAKLLFGILNHRPSEPVLFLPVVAQGRSVPVRITDVHVENDTLTLGVRPMSRAEQLDLIRHIRAGDDATVSARN